jgi:hypothetical protein
MGVLARQQRHIQKCEMENERLRRAGCWHGNEQRETARKEERIDLLALMHHSHELLALCATELSKSVQPDLSASGVADASAVATDSGNGGVRSAGDGGVPQHHSEQGSELLQEQLQTLEQEVRTWRAVAQQRSSALQESLELRRRRAQTVQEQHTSLQRMEHELVLAQEEARHCRELLALHHIPAPEMTLAEGGGKAVSASSIAEVLQSKLQDVRRQLRMAEEEAQVWQKLAEERNRALELALSRGPGRQPDEGAHEANSAQSLSPIILDPSSSPLQSAPSPHISAQPTLQLSSRSAPCASTPPTNQTPEEDARLWREVAEDRGR